MIMSYNGFGEISAVPGVPKITILLRVTREYGIVGTPIYDSAVSVPEIRWGALKNALPSAVVAFPPGARVPGTISLTAQKMPVPGEVVKLPGLSGTEAPPPPPPSTTVMQQPVAPMPAPMPPPPPSAAPAVDTAVPVAPTLAPPPPAPAAVPSAIPTGLATVVDVPGAGPTPLPVFVAQVSSPEIVPGPAGGLVVVVPRNQLPNLPTMPIRQAVGPRSAEGPMQIPPELWRMYFTFPVYRRGAAVDADPFVERASKAGTAASAGVVDTTAVSTAAGARDAEGRLYPVARDVVTGRASSTAAPATSDEIIVVGQGEPPPAEVQPGRVGWLLAAAVAAFFVVRR